MKTIQKIAISHIDLADETFCVNFMPDLQRLRSSIEQMGLIQPVLLRKKRNAYQIVCGFRRIAVSRELGTQEIESRVFDENAMDDIKLFSLSLHENLNTRGLNPIEKAIALDKLVHLFQMDPIIVIKNFLPLFSLEPNEKILNTYLSLAQMEDELKEYVLKEEVSRSNIRKLSGITSENRAALLTLFSSLRLGENRLREILTLLEEIARRDQLTIKSLILRPEIQAILSQKELIPSQKTERVRKALLDLRYPEMHRLEQSFEKKRKELDLPTKVWLRHAPFFEGKEMKIELQFETVEEYRSMLSSLSKLTDKKEFKEMIEGH